MIPERIRFAIEKNRKTLASLKFMVLWGTRRDSIDASKERLVLPDLIILALLSFFVMQRDPSVLKSLQALLDALLNLRGRTNQCIFA